MDKHISCVAIIGVGQVGAAVAYTLISGSVADELLIVDTRAEWRNGQPVRYGGNHRGVKIFLRDGPNKSRLSVSQHGDSPVRRQRDEAVPEISGLPPSQVLGSGTFLDTVRLRGLLADKAGVTQSSIDLHVLGIHGDAQVAVWSTATVDGIPLEKAALPCMASEADKVALAHECQNRSRSIIATKGTTSYGIASVVSSICTSILQDRRNVCPVSHFQPEFGCYFSLPAVLGRMGVVQRVPAGLSARENEAIVESAKELKSTLDRVQERY
ncbi:Uncharacterized protein PECH_004235 [Penicillium ucsense]|uniref:Lactate/malate dehydrogenase C-terminal domain-containing protein n=1 Tax=Penicillium ucsense TaxID=2839758 RepID=A0A8J8VVS1_9EURO|nr:Uncharacterized protein PECM_003786 [Penicillium ucsense]KAF7726893.1 Uncharacterized protein PECH_004235 [Penicillium ucsense]